MKTYTSYGSCQADALARILNAVPEFAAEWQYMRVPACFDMSVEQLDSYSDSAIKNVDLFLHQPISPNHYGVEFSTDYLRTNIATNATHISFQYLHWEGNSPTFNSPYGLPAHPLGYVDSLVAQAVLDGKPLQTLLDRLSLANQYLAENVSEIGAWCVDQLRSREGGDNDGGRPIDITATDFIAATWETERLFYTMNHPSKAMLWYVAANLLERLGYNPSTVDVSKLPDPLSFTTLPTYKKPGVSSFYREQFKWFSEKPKDDVANFVERLAESRFWIKGSYNHAFN
jgi:hypothetical protein